MNAQKIIYHALGKTAIDTVCLLTTDETSIAMAWYAKMYVPNRVIASSFLFHYLIGSGYPVYVKIEDLLQDIPKFESIIRNTISRYLFKSRFYKCENRGIPFIQPEYPNTEKAQDWRYAIGSFIMNWTILSIDILRGEANIELNFRNKYRWHPDVNRVSQCIHQAAENMKSQGAAEFWIIGKSYKMIVRFNKFRLLNSYYNF